MVSEELKACPCCGATDVKQWRDRDHFWSIQCLACGLNLLKATESHALAAWNRRTPSEPVSREAEKVKGDGVPGSDGLLATE